VKNDLPTETMHELREWNNKISVPRENYYQPRTVDPVKTYLRMAK
jgi:hypothetical protein